MAYIDTELQTIATSIYGSEMREAIHDAIEKVNDDVVDLNDLVDRAESETGTFGTQGSTHFFGTYKVVKRLGIATINIDIAIDYTVPYERPSGTIIDDTGVLLFTLPDKFKISSSDSTCKIGMYPIGDDRYNNDIPYVQIIYTTGDVRLYYGWDDVITEVGTGYELIVNHTYISKLSGS